MFKIKDGIELRVLNNYGFTYCGNYNRGDMYERENKQNKFLGIHIQGDWDNRKIGFMFPYAKEIKTNVRIEDYIQDLIQAGLVEKVERD